MSRREETQPTGEKKGSKRGLVVESRGLPIGITISGANTHDIKLLEATLQSIVTAHPEGANMCLDAGYVGAWPLVEAMGYAAHIRGRGKRNRSINGIHNSRRGGEWSRFAICG